MSFYSEDNRLTPQNIEEFNKKGWTLVDLKLSPNVLKMATLGLKQMKIDAIKNSYINQEAIEVVSRPKYVHEYNLRFAVHAYLD